MASSRRKRQKSKQGSRVPKITNKEDKGGRVKRMDRDRMREIRRELDERHDYGETT